MHVCVFVDLLDYLREKDTPKLAFPYITIHSSSMGVSLHFLPFIHQACRLLQLGNMTFSEYFILTLICVLVCKKGTAEDIFGALW